MADPDPPEDALSNLRRRVDAARAEKAQSEAPRQPDSAANLAMRMGGEFASAVLVGAALGFGADLVLKAQPWGLVAGLGLGFITGVVNIVRAARAYSTAHPVDPNTPQIADEEDED